MFHFLTLLRGRRQPDPPKIRLLAVVLAFVSISLACSVTAPVFPIQGPTPAPTHTFIPSPAASAGLIVYAGNDGNIYVIDRDGHQKSAVTQDATLTPAAGQIPRIYQYPTWAPDGRHLAYMSFSRPESSGLQASLFTSLPDGSERIQAFSSQNAAPFYLFWSPDSQTISFLSNDPGGGEILLNLAPAAGGENIVIGSGQPYYWDWSPDNRTLIIHTGGSVAENPNARLALVDLESPSQIRELDLKPGFFQAPAWSPAGDNLALTLQNEAGEGELVLAGRDGKVKQVLASLSGPAAFAWALGGSRLAYSSLVQTSTGSVVRLAVVDPTQPDRNIEVAQGDVVAFFWSPDGQKIAYFSLAGEKPGVTARRVAQTFPSISLVVQVYDFPSGASKQVAAFVPTDSFLQVIPYYDQYQRSGTLWSPDSQNLVLASVDSAGQSAIYVASADGSQYRKIADGDLAFWSWK